MPVEIPQNQTDALPVTTAVAVADPGDIELVNGRIRRHWTPARTGINRLNRREFANPPFGVQMYVAADPLPLLDFSGINTFTFAVRRELTGPTQPIGPTMEIFATPSALGQSPLPFNTVQWNVGLPRLGRPLCQFAFNTAPAIPTNQYGYGGCSNRAPSQAAPEWVNGESIVGAGGWSLFLIGPTAAVAGENEFWYLEAWGDS